MIFLLYSEGVAHIVLRLRFYYLLESTRTECSNSIYSVTCTILSFATKHISIGKEEIGVHFSYLYNKRKEYKLNGIAAGISYNPTFAPELRMIAEYDSKDFALGATYLLLKHLHIQVELQKMKYFTGGLCFQFRLK